MTEFTHTRDNRVHMVDISEKEDVYREAIAKGRIYLRQETLRLIAEKNVPKGNVLATSQIAAILAIKKTPELIPMCHQIPIHSIDVDFVTGDRYIEAIVTVKSCGKTGVEMEALTGVTAALLTIWDMVKSVEKDSEGQYLTTCINEIKVVEKIKKNLIIINAH